ncbi:hypothetical protein EDB89DRAFT_1964540 [Lactarius sanguifluus]|nr:hypothetical protein EDB89DRAFT_1964540 [Lactarius sanguifluus]
MARRVLQLSRPVFFAPIFASIAPGLRAVLVVGMLMICNVREIGWDYIGDALIIPLTINIAYGVIADIASYILLNGLPWVVCKVSGDRIVPSNYGSAEPWIVPPGGIVPVWMFVSRLFACTCCLTTPSQEIRSRLCHRSSLPSSFGKHRQYAESIRRAVLQYPIIYSNLGLRQCGGSLATGRSLLVPVVASGFPCNVLSSRTRLTLEPIALANTEIVRTSSSLRVGFHCECRCIA